MGSRSFFPDHEGNFNLPDTLRFSTLLVEGDTLSTISAASPSLTVSSSPFTASGSGSSHSNSIPPVFRATHSRKHNLRVILAEMIRQSSGKVFFTEKTQVFIPLTEAVANVPYVLNEVSKEWPEMELILVTSDGLPIIDSEGTRGMLYYKCFKLIIVCSC